MSEVQTRPAPSARGRGSSRGGRGGSSFGSRGGARNIATNGVSHDGIDENSDLGQIKKRYNEQLERLKEMFPDLNSEDILFELQENAGDLQVTASKITEGSTAQWGEVKKKNKDRSRSKAKDSSPSASYSDSCNDSHQSSRLARGGRSSFDGARGGRGRGGLESRGGRGGRGRGGVSSNGISRHQTKDSASDIIANWGEASNGISRHQTKDSANDIIANWGGEASNSPPTDGPPFTSETKPEGGDDNGLGASLKPSVKQEEIKGGDDGWGASPKPAAKLPFAPATSSKTSWASLLKPAVPPPAPVQQKPIPQQPVQPIPEKVVTPPDEPEKKDEAPVEVEPSPEPEEPVANVDPIEEPKEDEFQPVAEDDAQQLTEDNLEKIEDVAPPPPTDTQASTVATSNVPDPGSIITSQVQAAAPQAPARHTPVSKGTPGRTFRRVFEQQEGVVMPGNHAEVNRAALQFGSMGLSGDLDDEDEIEQAETVSQPPQPSPMAQPIASLPPTGPASQLHLSQSQSSAIPEILTTHTPRQAPGLPSQPQAAPQTNSHPPLGPQSMTQHQVHPQLTTQYNRYGVPEQQSQSKQYDSFGHLQQQAASQQPPNQPQQAQTQHHQNQHQNYAQYMQPQQQPGHIGINPSSAAEQQHYNYYSDRSQPPGFSLYGNSSYMHGQQAHGQQEAGATQQRTSSGLGGAAESQAPTSVGGPNPAQANSRYGGDQGSGHATPSPAPPVQQASQHQQGMGQQTYPMQFHPYYNQYMHQNFYSQPAAPFGKNMYGYPQYVPSQYPDHSSSPAALGGFAAPSGQGRESMAGVADYNRMNTSAAQQSLPQHSTAGGYGNGIPNFLNSRGLPQDQQQLGGGSVGQQSVQQVQNDDLKFGENKPPTGPSSGPSLQGQPGRPGSATSGTAGLGLQQGAQTPAGMYSSHLNPNLHGAHQGQGGYGVAQGQGGSHYSMYSGGYPSQYSQGSGRHTGAGANSGWPYSH